MYEQFLEVTYDKETNTAKSIYRCGNTEEIIHYEGERNGLVKFTPDTWPIYLSNLYGRALPTLVEGYGYIKYIEDAIDIGVPEQVYSKYNLRSKTAPARNKIASIRVERFDYSGNLIESKVIYDDEDAVWFNIETGGMEVPVGEDPVEYGLKIADGAIPVPSASS